MNSKNPNVQDEGHHVVGIRTRKSSAQAYCEVCRSLDHPCELPPKRVEGLQLARRDVSRSLNDTLDEHLVENGLSPPQLQQEGEYLRVFLDGIGTEDGVNRKRRLLCVQYPVFTYSGLRAHTW